MDNNFDASYFYASPVEIGAWGYTITAGCFDTRPSKRLSGLELSSDMRFPTMWYVRPQRLRSACAYASQNKAFASRLNIL